MQNVALISFADELTQRSGYHGPGASAFVGIVTFAQLGPILFLSPFGGVIADAINRRTLLAVSAALQAAFSLVLAAVAASAAPPWWSIVAVVAAIGIVGSANGPASQAMLPSLVGKLDLPGAVALNSAQMNASRVIGPLLAVTGWLQGPSHAFVFNAITYLFVIAAVLGVRLPAQVAAPSGEGPMERLRGGFDEARRNAVVGRALAIVSVYSLFSLVFIYQMKGFARTELHLPADRFYVLFGCFGLGAAAGAIAVGTGLALLPRHIVVRWGLATFALALGAYSLMDRPGPAYLLVAVTGFSYFVVITSLSTSVQESVSDAVRGRVMGLWMMAWAGLVPVGSMVAGLVIDRTGHRPVLLAGAAVAAVLAGYSARLHQ